MIFAVLILVITILYFMIYHKRIRVFRKVYLGKDLYLFLVGLILILISGLRAFSIGIDTSSYFARFQLIRQYDFCYLFNLLGRDQGYLFIEFLISIVFNNFTVMLVLVAITSVLPFIILTKRYSNMILISLVLYITLGFYTISFSTLRQSMAIGLVLISTNYIIKGNFLKFLLSVALASTLHFTAIIFLPVYLFKYLKIKNLSILFMSLLALGSIIIRGQIQSVMLAFYGRSVESVETGGLGVYLLAFITVALGYFFRKNLSKNSASIIMYYIVFAGLVLMPITLFHPAVTRINWYFLVFQPILVSNIIKSIKSLDSKVIITVFYLVITTYVFFSRIIISTELIHYKLVFG